MLLHGGGRRACLHPGQAAHPLAVDPALGDYDDVHGCSERVVGNQASVQADLSERREYSDAASDEFKYVRHDCDLARVLLPEVCHNLGEVRADAQRQVDVHEPRVEGGREGKLNCAEGDKSRGHAHNFRPLYARRLPQPDQTDEGYVLDEDGKVLAPR